MVDNCEHLIGEAASVVEHLLARCPQLRDHRDEPRGAQCRRRDHLAGPTARTRGRPGPVRGPSRRRRGVTAAAAGAEGVEELCTRLDGLPLAIELAAARVRTIPVQQLSERLDDRFRLLTGGARTALPRQQTLRAVVEWSYDLLFEDERRVFEHLSVFAGGCSLDAAEAVSAGDGIAPEDIADLLGRLVDKSLVVVDHSSGAARFDLLQTLALYGRERLADIRRCPRSPRPARGALRGAVRARSSRVSRDRPGRVARRTSPGGGQRPRRACLDRRAR